MMGGRRLTIIGGGIAGLVCAALAQARGFAVTVVEAGPSVGGLWKSTEVHLGDHRLSLDAGLRLPVATGDDALDRLIFHRPDFAFDWIRLNGWPREGAITANIFNPENSCLDATVLGEALEAVIAEMRSASADTGATVSALEHSLRCYGPTLTHGLIRDAVMGLFETDMAELEAKAISWFVPRRVVLGDHRATAALLADERLAGRVAHARHKDLPAGGNRPFLHPREGGISTWVTALYVSLQRAGVTFMLNDGLRAIELDTSSRGIGRLTLKSGHVLETDEVICTLAPALLAQAAGMPMGPPPRFRHLRISHVLVDRPPAHRTSYGLNFNRHPAFFRVVFHDNLHALPDGAHVLTFEHLVDEAGTPDLVAKALVECRSSGAMPAGTRLIASHADQYRNSVPLPTIAQGRAAAAYQRALAPIRNLRFVGRSAGGAPFLDQIIREADAAMTATMEHYAHV